MASIVLTSKCNLNCDYCFAKDYTHNLLSEFTIDNFKKAIDFIKTSSVPETIQIVGGEPTLHPLFRDFIEILKNDDKIPFVILFTNGLELDKYVDVIKSSKIRILINCNSPQNIGEKQFDKLKKNIELLVKSGNTSFNLGINLYSLDMDFSYIFDLLNIANKKDLRFSLALSNSEKVDTTDVLDSFRKFKPLLMKFYELCLENEVAPYSDCNKMPPCLYSDDDKKILKELAVVSKKLGIPSVIQDTMPCTPIFDILPDLNAMRSFCFQDCQKVPIEKLKTFDNLRNYVYKEIEYFNKVTFLADECKSCSYYMFDKCGVCPNYKIEKIKQLKKCAFSL